MEKNKILQELNELKSPLSGLPREMPYKVPDGYFEGLADSALRTARNSDVPTGYFQTLPQAMLTVAKAANVPGKAARRKTHIVALPLRRWVAAAILLISLMAGGLILFDRPMPRPAESTLAALPTDAVMEYAEANLPMSHLADDAVAASALRPNLSNLSTDELQAYLDQSGWIEQPL